MNLLLLIFHTGRSGWGESEGQRYGVGGRQLGRKKVIGRKRTTFCAGQSQRRRPALKLTLLPREKRHTFAERVAVERFLHRLLDKSIPPCPPPPTLASQHKTQPRALKDGKMNGTHCVPPKALAIALQAQGKMAELGGGKTIIALLNNHCLATWTRGPSRFISRQTLELTRLPFSSPQAQIFFWGGGGSDGGGGKESA